MCYMEQMLSDDEEQDFEVEDDSIDMNSDPKQAWLDMVEKQQQSGWRSQIDTFLPTFKGYCWRICTMWKDIIPTFDHPIRYLEIGTLSGANMIAFIKLYGTNPESRFECIDPWIDHEQYNEYKTPDTATFNIQNQNYQDFLDNIEAIGETQRVKAYRDFSHNIVPTLSNNTYDLIYIDGNHRTENVLEDGILALRKCKLGGWIVFDDYDWTSACKAIDCFVDCYENYFEDEIYANGQVYLKRNDTKL